MDYKNKATQELIEKIIASGVRDMPQNPASQGLSERQIRAYYYLPEEKILYLIQEIEGDLGKRVENIAIENADLNNFEPEMNKYYKHVGETTSEFTKGIIYLYDGQFKPVNAEKGEKGDKGETGAKLVSQVLQGQDENGGNVYLQTFDDGTTATFVAPRGASGEGGGTSNYNGLSNIPIINADLDNITPEASTYYRHIGESETNYKKGEIYFYATIATGSTQTKYFKLLTNYNPSRKYCVPIIRDNGEQDYRLMGYDSIPAYSIAQRLGDGTLWGADASSNSDGRTLVNLNTLNAKMGHCWKLEVDTGNMYGKFTFLVPTTANNLTDLASDIVNRHCISGYMVISEGVWNTNTYYGMATAYISCLLPRRCLSRRRFARTRRKND